MSPAVTGEQPAGGHRHQFQFQKDKRTFFFCFVFPIAVSFIDAFQMATDGGTCAINNIKRKEGEEEEAKVSDLI